jgi:hypothetical protein
MVRLPRLASGAQTFFITIARAVPKIEFERRELARELYDRRIWPT